MNTSLACQKSDYSMQVDDSLRILYHRIWIEQEIHHADDPKWWESEFINLANEILQITKLDEIDQLDSKQTNDDSSREIEIFCQNKTYRFNPFKKQVITIGRKSTCDIHVLNAYVSRVAVLIYILPKHERLLLVDVGSRNGIKILDQLNAKQNASKNYERNILDFNWNESVAIKIVSDIGFVLNPRECLICYERPRSTRFQPCMHFISCFQCARRVQKCPTCKHEILSKEYNVSQIHSYLGR